MGGFVSKRGDVERVTITREQLTEIAKILKIPAPTQVQSVSVAVHTRKPSGKKPAAKK